MTGPGHHNDFTGGDGDVHAVVQAGAVHGGVHLTMPAPHPAALPIPAQLRATPGCWSDRTDELDLLDRYAQPCADADHGQTPSTGHDDAPTLVVITGAGGVGKTALALRWLHQLRPQYRDGQLFTDLRGFSGIRPADPGEVLERFLRALGISPDQLPRDVHEQSALFRSVTAERRLIILLDNAASAAQVRPLLPGAGRCLVVVTTRRTLPGLRVEGAHYLDLQPLDETGAQQLLDAMAGADRAAADPDAARALIAHCGRLPLALTACAAHLATHRHTPIARLVTRLNDERTRLA
ncbi:regulator, partial [Actinomadura sp. KC216]|uniref:ATP-binding protein n=1 Tax=Actinomadura sp. KC216 TaxID=2530370 RepID=UPI0010D898F0